MSLGIRWSARITAICACFKKLHRFGGVGADHDFKIVFQQGVDRFQNLRLVVHHQALSVCPICQRHAVDTSAK